MSGVLLKEFIVAFSLENVHSLKEMATRRKVICPKRSPRIRGICALADALGVTRDHLRLVIQGKRLSRSLTARLNQIVERASAKNKGNI